MQHLSTGHDHAKRPVTFREIRSVISGHGRLLAAKEIGLTEVPTVELSHLTETQKRAYIIADNALALQSGWDEEVLKSELAALSEGGYDLELTGLLNSEIEELLSTDISVTEATEAAQDAVDDEVDDIIPDTPSTPTSRSGDVWKLGDHRLICGDATDPAVVHKLMQGKNAHLVFTSPPYLQQRDYLGGGNVDWNDLMQGVFSNLPLTDTGQVLVNLGLVHKNNEVVTYYDSFIQWMRAQGYRYFGQCVWDQGPGMPGIGQED